MDKKRKMVTCYCCGKKDHVSKDCRFKSYACNACRKKGHLEIVYKNKKSSKEEKGNSQKQKRADVKTKNVKSLNHYLEESKAVMRA